MKYSWGLLYSEATAVATEMALNCTGRIFCAPTSHSKQRLKWQEGREKTVSSWFDGSKKQAGAGSHRNAQECSMDGVAGDQIIEKGMLR
jgi:hypothetical protein